MIWSMGNSVTDRIVALDYRRDGKFYGHAYTSDNPDNTVYLQTNAASSTPMWFRAVVSACMTE